MSGVGPVQSQGTYRTAPPAVPPSWEEGRQRGPWEPLVRTGQHFLPSDLPGRAQPSSPHTARSSQAPHTAHTEAPGPPGQEPPPLAGCHLLPTSGLAPGMPGHNQAGSGGPVRATNLPPGRCGICTRSLLPAATHKGGQHGAPGGAPWLKTSAWPHLSISTAARAQIH